MIKLADLTENPKNARAIGGLVEAEGQRVVVSKTETTTVGNAAAMRDALNEIDRVVWDKKRHTKEETEAHRLATEALSAPARNCDVYTHDEALEVWEAEKENERNGCFDEWLYHVAAEEGAGT